MNPIANGHHATQAWCRVMAALRRGITQAQVSVSHVVVLLPYVQLIPLARAAWLRSAPGDGLAASFLPRFDTTLNWAASLGGFVPQGDDLRHDAAHDVLTAAALLGRAGLASGATAMATRLMEAAWSLARVAAAVHPAQRSAWGAERALALQSLGHAPVLAMETALGRLAVAWAANSAYATDVLLDAEPGLLVLLEGLQVEPLHAALRAARPDDVLSLSLMEDAVPAGVFVLHQAQDAQDEAERAAACVVNHLAEGRGPVALVAQDRLLTRRVRAMLGEQGIAVRDETGWTLSTTRAASGVMALLRAMAWDASSDQVLDWAKGASALAAAFVAGLEMRLRRYGVRDWRRVQSDSDDGGIDALVASINTLREDMAASRSISDWLQALRAALQGSGQWQMLVGDVAGQKLLEALHLQGDIAADFGQHAQRMPQAAFVAWVGQVLEAVNFHPPHPPRAQVLILPASQLLGRPLEAVVMPGCDEARLPASPEPGGLWTPAQRELLGLPSRDELAQIARATWQHVLASPRLDLLWRSSAEGEHLMPSALVQVLLLEGAIPAPDPRGARGLRQQPMGMPQPAGDQLVVTRLSASAYEDLRTCPYRFFALRQLGLQDVDELDGEVDKRDFGTWLHAALRHFHESLAGDADVSTTRCLHLIDEAAVRATAELGLGDAEFLPFSASWPRVRDHYLQWLLQHVSKGARFARAEVPLDMPLGTVQLNGRIDRMDQLVDGDTLVIDYKTESRSRTAARIKDGAEDTQLAFYAALLPDDTVHAMYLSVAESEPTRAYGQPDIVALRDLLVEGIQDDLERIANGTPLPALGEGSACDYCAARGLCRKDFWSMATPGSQAGTSHA